MNFDFHIFSSRDGYEQYPQDKNVASFYEYARKRNKGSLLAVVRNPKIVRYIYVQGIGGTKDYFGFCVTFNDLCFTNIEQVFGLFEKLYETVVYEGKFLRIDNDGKISFTSGTLSSKVADFEILRGKVFTAVEELPRRATAVLPSSYKINAQEASVSLSDGNKAILDKVANNGCVYIHKNSSESSDLNYVGQMLSDLHRQNDRLQTELTAVKRQKNQYRTVLLLLALLLVGAGIAAYVIIGNNQIINSQSYTISELNETIDFKNRQITQTNDQLRATKLLLQESIAQSDSLTKVVSQVRDSAENIGEELDYYQQRVRSLESRVRSAESEARSYSNRMNSSSSSTPFTITSIKIGNQTYDSDIINDFGNTIYSSQTMYLTPKIYYSCSTSGTYDLEIRWYKPDGSLSRGSSSPSNSSYSNSLSMYSGSDKSAVLKGWGGKDRGHWAAGSYRIEIWYKNTCVGSKNFTIY